MADEMVEIGKVYPNEDEIAAWVAREIGRRANMSLETMTSIVAWVTDLRTAFRPLGIDPALREPGYYAQDWNCC
jgi:hypothetical protein